MVEDIQKAIDLLQKVVDEKSPPVDSKFSKYFTLEEVTRSRVATRQGINNKPTKAIETQLQHICKFILDPIREKFGVPIKVTSGYRCAKLNEVIGGSPKSQHMCKNLDAAIDFRFIGNKIDLEECFKWITQESNLDYDQCIAEFLPGGWIHISYKINGPNRKKTTIAKKEKGKTVYVNV